MPENDDILRDLLASMHAYQDNLLNALIRRLDGSMLQQIAEADYGSDQDKHLRALLHICESRSTVGMSWEPHEVLSLIRFSRPEDPKWGPGGQGERGHIMRAFSCAALLHTADYGDDITNATLAPLIESVMILNDDLPGVTREFVAWLLSERPPAREELVFFVLGLILLQTQLAPDDHAWFERAIHWIDLEDSCVRMGEYPPLDQRWVWGLSFFSCEDIWLRLIQSLLLGENQQSATLRRLGERLVAAHGDKRRTRRPR